MGPVRSDHCLRRVLTGVAQPPPGEDRGLGGRLAPGLPPARSPRSSPAARRRLRGGLCCGPGRRGRCGHGCGRGRSDRPGPGVRAPSGHRRGLPGTGPRPPGPVVPGRSPARGPRPHRGDGMEWGGVASAPRWSGTPGKSRRCSRRAAGPETAARPRPAMGRPLRRGRGVSCVSAVPRSPPPVPRPLPTCAAAGAWGCRPWPVYVRAPRHRVRTGVGKGPAGAVPAAVPVPARGCVNARARIPG